MLRLDSIRVGALLGLLGLLGAPILAVELTDAEKNGRLSLIHI